MKNDQDIKFEQIINEAISLRDQGKPIAEILKLFPDSGRELEEIFQAIEFLGAKKDEFAPEESLLKDILVNFSMEQKLSPSWSDKFKFGLVGFGRFFVLRKFSVGLVAAALVIALVVGLDFNKTEKKVAEVAIDGLGGSEEISAKNEGTAEVKSADSISFLDEKEKSLQADFADFEKEYKEVQGLGQNESLKDLDSLLSDVNNEIL